MARFKVMLSGSALKVLAAAAMTCDHVASVLLDDGGTAMSLRLLGRLAFPLYAFLLAEGFAHTRRLGRYVLTVALFALLSEVPFDLALHGRAWYPQEQSVMLTLLLGLLAMAFEDRMADRRVAAVAVVTIALAAQALHADYGARGVALILLFHLLRENTAGRALAGACILPNGWAAAAAFLPIAAYDGTRGFVRGAWMKYAFYAYYPLHLTILWSINQYL